MKEIDFESLKKRRERIFKLRAQANEKQHIGIGYELIIDGRHYPVLSCFPVGANDECADAKFKYLINGQKS